MTDDLPFPMKSNRQPKVIVFEEPGKKKNQNNVTRKRKIDSNETELESTPDFIDVAREVKEFGATGFTRKDQKKNKQKYAESLGARKVKQQKVPYPMLMDRVKRRKEKEEKGREMERAMGIFQKKKKEEKVKPTLALNLGRWVDKSTLGRVGNSNNNSMKIDKNEIFKMKSKKR